MSGTPPFTRKRPQCHSCGTLMAGHRRVNGRYVCPDDDDDTSITSAETVTPSPRRSARLNSHSREQETPPPPSTSTRPGPSNWDAPSRPRSAKREQTTSPAPTVLSEEYYCKTEDDSFYTENEFVGSPDASQHHASKLGPASSLRTFTRKLRLSTPLASIFTAPRSEIEGVQQEAGRHGLYAGTVYKPRKIKEEESQRWLVLGRDPNTVDRLVDCQRTHVARQLGLETQAIAPAPVPGAIAMPPSMVVLSEGPSWWRRIVDALFWGSVGALILFYILVYVF